MVNKERIEKLAAFIAAGTLPWDMSDTRTCFFGQARGAFPDDEYPGGSMEEFLGVQHRPHGPYSLVMPNSYQNSSLYPRERAIAQLHYIAESGKVDWSATPAE